MKKILLTLTVAALSALTTHASIVYSNSFGYADGALTTVSVGSPLGVWGTHSGAAGNVQVASGLISLVTTLTEDVNASITNGINTGFTNETLYASFKVNFSVLPTANTYFAHFMQNATTFRAKVFSTITGAASGKFRLGINNSSSTIGSVIATDFDLGTEYKVVVRFVGGTNTTLWINPTSEASIVDTTTAADATAQGSYFTALFGFRESSGMGTMTIDDLLIGTAFSDVQTVGGPPSISGLINVSIPGNTNTGPRAFVVSDVETAAASLTVAANSYNATLVPNNPANLTLASIDGTNRTLTVTPALGQQGTAGIEAIVTDGNGEKSTNSFTITVGLPSISTIPDQIVLSNTVSSAIAFTVSDNESNAADLIVTAVSSDQGVVPDANISIQSQGGGNRTITLTNIGPGITIVTVTVNDGTFNVTTTFRFTAHQPIGVVLADTFTYTDGSLITNSLFFWSHHSGITGQVQVASGKVTLSSTNTEDINAYFTNAPGNGGFVTNGGFVFYSRFVVKFSALPTGSGGDYFAHFKEFGSSAFKARVFALTNGAAPGTYRLGIANGGTVSATFPQDLSLNTTYTVITRYNVSSAAGSTLWVDPLAESSTSVTATDSTSSTTIYSYAFRENTGIGTLTLDDLKIGSLFSEVNIGVPPRLTAARSGSDVVVTWTTNFGDVFDLQQKTDLNTSTWSAGPATSIVESNYSATILNASGKTFFRLRGKP